MNDELHQIERENIDASNEEAEWDEEVVEEMVTMQNGEVVTKKEYAIIRDTISNLNK